ncbi:hypothetical protein [Streptomyces mirabilis]|uniref:hypothetical protein n=1 Tax=Streptomyces mirabilis TaxID=68239 RepID=UPI0036C8524C
MSQQPQQPGWATPQQDPEPGTPQPKKKRRIGKILGIWCLSALGLFIILGAIGSGGGKKTSSASDAKPSATASASKPAKAVVASKPGKNTPSSSPTKAVKTSAPATAAPAAKKPATAEARKKAAAILKKEDADFRTFLAKGESVVGTPDFTAWYQKAIVGLDMKQTAFSKADAFFTADNEPNDLIEAWRSDNGDANAAITQYSVDGLSPDAPNAANRQDAKDALGALAKADKDADRIANG